MALYECPTEPAQFDVQQVAPSSSNADRRLVLLLHEDQPSAHRLAVLLSGHHLDTQIYRTLGELLLSIDSLPPATCLVAFINNGKKCGLRAYEQLKALGFRLPVVFLAAERDPRQAVAAMRAGAEDFLPVPVSDEEFIAAVSRALTGNLELNRNPDLLALGRRIALLTPQERTVIELVVSGLLNKQIADQLRLALITVKVHRGRAMRKLGVKNAAQLGRFTLAAGIGQPKDSMPSLGIKAAR
jgi:two-component system response regulator DctR